jgi:hypothetical protein
VPRRRSPDRARSLAAPLLLGALAGCASLGGGSRPAGSSLACARAAVAEVVTPAMTDKRKHCAGAASIAARCSVLEARLAYYGKEVSDMLGGGDPELEDLRADRAGVACARTDPAADAVLACCAAAGY